MRIEITDKELRMNELLFSIWYLVLFNLPLGTSTLSRYFEREREKGDIGDKVGGRYSKIIIRFDLIRFSYYDYLLTCLLRKR